MLNLLKELEYFDIHHLMQLVTPESLKHSITDIYGNCTEYEALKQEEKKALLDSMYWKNPTRFKFLPGEKSSLIFNKTLYTSLVGILHLVFVSPIMEELTPTFIVKAGRQGIYTNKQQQSCQQQENSCSLQRTKVVDNCGKTISTDIDNWCSVLLMLHSTHLLLVYEILQIIV
jgi:hypothetical protein